MPAGDGGGVQEDAEGGRGGLWRRYHRQASSILHHTNVHCPKIVSYMHCPKNNLVQGRNTRAGFVN